MSSSNVKSLEPMFQNTNHAHEESSNTRIQEGNQESDKLVTSHLIKPIEQRLSVLEEEDEVLKESVLGSMEEMTVLTNEILTQFQAIHNDLRLTNQERESSYFDEVLVSTQALKKERRPGLLQVLWQESNPSLITRYVKAREVPVQGPEKFARHYSSKS